MDSDRRAATRRYAHVSALAFFLVATSFSAAAIAASPSAADKDTARALMSQGNDLRAKGDLKGALQSFQAADAIMHVPSTGIEVAKTEAALGELVEARDTALAVARTTPTPGEPKPFTDARKEAQTLGNALEPRIPALQITVKNAPSGTTPAVDVDGVSIPAAAIGFPHKVNPGHHVIAATAGTAHAQAEVDVAEHETKGVVVELPESAAPPPVAAVPAPSMPSHASTPSDHPKKKFPVLAVAGFAVGAVGIAVGSVTGLMSISKTSSLKDECPNDQCPASTFDSDQFQSDKSSAATLGTVSTIAFIVGGAGIAVGIVGLVLPRGNASAHASTTGSTKPLISPWISPAPGGGAAGLSGTF